MYKRILVAVDDSTTSNAALNEAISLAKTMGAALRIVHVTDEVPIRNAIGLEALLDVAQVEDAMRQAGRALLDAAAKKAADAGVQAETDLLEAPSKLEASHKRVAEWIVEGADTWQADVIVAGTHGRRGFARLFVGNVAEDLVRLANTSLVLVRGR
ncbi:universal stress protein [Aromatoleum diolicum]|uniref:Universal stress protein n=1 Tax=Aromatoleum diolicum TaxID=75796 RepID=A0ABX1QFQ3_9RHOO|nr:universal stress protein [Aromatoleum diolicum]NMG77229.1 universal stress protein [Aromatoleum diolicum]